jgi:phosphopantothenoylcysteine decarboxylase / phosphopantothenate---cysteine ligase
LLYTYHKIHKRFMVLSENSALPVYFMLQKLYNKDVSLCLEGIRPATVADDKIKKKDGDLSIPVERTEDILGTIGPRKTHQFLCGFSMETRDLVENSSAKLAKKNLDMVVANNLKVAGAGFGVDTNVVTFITPDGTRELPLMSKADVADAILDEILQRRAK